MAASRARTVEPISASRPKTATKAASKSSSKSAGKSKTSAATSKAKRTTKAGTSKSTKAAASTSVVTHEQVAERAYQIWQRKGRPIGLDDQNWTEAERELGLRP